MSLTSRQKELDRLDLIHQMMKIAIRDKLHLAPLEQDKPMKILDIGTGTGIWAIEMGRFFPLKFVSNPTNRMILE